MRVAGASR
jgi:protocatechuate 3,4-dioxygenase beta subunit